MPKHDDPTVRALADAIEPELQHIRVTADRAIRVVAQVMDRLAADVNRALKPAPRTGTEDDRG